jgi:hypothetical protein
MSISGTPFSCKLSLVRKIGSGAVSIDPNRDARSARQRLHSLLHRVEELQFKPANCAKGEDWR